METERNPNGDTTNKLISLDRKIEKSEDLFEQGYMPLGRPTSINLFIESKKREDYNRRQVCADGKNLHFSLKELNEAIEMARPDSYRVVGYVSGIPITSNNCMVTSRNGSLLLTFPIQFYMKRK